MSCYLCPFLPSLFFACGSCNSTDKLTQYHKKCSVYRLKSYLKECVGAASSSLSELQFTPQRKPNPEGRVNVPPHLHQTDLHTRRPMMRTKELAWREPTPPGKTPHPTPLTPPSPPFIFICRSPPTHTHTQNQKTHLPYRANSLPLAF